MTTKEAIAYWEVFQREIDLLYPLCDERSKATLGEQREPVALALSALRAQQEAETNHPLTLDELRQMDGEPVWVVPTGETDWSAHWDIFGQGYATASSNTKRAKMYFLYAEHLGKTWLAYRHKTEET